MNMNEAMEAAGTQSVPLRTFRVSCDWNEDVYIFAHAFVCEGKTVKFYTYKPDVANDAVLIAYNTRSLRNWLEIEDVSAELLIGVGSTKLN